MEACLLLLEVAHLLSIHCNRPPVHIVSLEEYKHIRERMREKGRKERDKLTESWKKSNYGSQILSRRIFLFQTLAAQTVQNM